MKKPFKLLIFAKHIDGGTGTFALQLLKLRKMFKGSISIKILAIEKPQYRSIKTSNISISYFNRNSRMPFKYKAALFSSFSLLKEFLIFRREVYQFKPNILISIDNHCNIFACILKLLFYSRFKIILTIHNNTSAVATAKLSLINQFIFRKVGHFLFQISDEIVCVSKGVAQDFQKYFNLKKEPLCIYYGVDSNYIISQAKKKIDNKDRELFSKKVKNIISVGRLSPQKDFETLIHAMVLVVQKNQPCNLYIIGDGENKKQLVSLVKKNHLENHIYFLGWKQNIYSYIKRSDVFVLSSHFEGFPYLLLEAEALKKPILASNVNFGPRELIKNNLYGRLFPIKDAKKLASEIILMLNDKKIRNYYAKQAQKRAHSFAEEKMLLQYKRILKKLD